MTPPQMILGDFARAYFFCYRVRLRNAEALRTICKMPVNGIMYELIDGYINAAVSGLALNLYDAVACLKKVDSNYRYRDGAISRVMAFRRTILAHRSQNWHSEESKRFRNQMNEMPTQIFDDCCAAAEEFVYDVKQRGVVLDPGSTRPVTLAIREPELRDLSAR